MQRSTQSKLRVVFAIYLHLLIVQVSSVSTSTLYEQTLLSD